MEKGLTHHIYLLILLLPKKELSLAHLQKKLVMTEGFEGLSLPPAGLIS